jgi:hypothetical protein
MSGGTPGGNRTLTEADLAAYSPRVSAGGQVLQAFCPFHGSRRQRSLRVQVHSGRFVCVLCGAWGTVEAGCQRWRAELQRQPTDRRSRVRQRRVPRHPQPTTGGGRRRSPHGTPGHNSRYISSESSRLTT